MAFIIKNNEINNKKENKRKGFMYAPRTTSINVKNELFLKNSFIVRNRESKIAKSNNVFEVFCTDDPADGENYMFIGRHGVLDKSEFKNVNYIELAANYDSTKPQSTQSQNGTIANYIYGDKASDQKGGLFITYAGNFGDGLSGVISLLDSKGDGSVSDFSQASLQYVNTSYNINDYKGWVKFRTYIVGDLYQNNGSIYRVNTEYTSGKFFGSVDYDNTSLINASFIAVDKNGITMRGLADISNNWGATTSYVSGDFYNNAGTQYRVITPYTSGGSFGSLDTSNSEQLPVGTVYRDGSLLRIV